MRDPAVQALYALHLTPVELDAVLAGQSIRRETWPPQRCQGVVVGLCAGGAVVGEATLLRAESAPPALVVGLRFMGGTPPKDRVLWHFGPVVRYTQPLPHPSSVRSRAMSSPMPEAPVGTLTAPVAPMW